MFITEFQLTIYDPRSAGSGHKLWTLSKKVIHITRINTFGLNIEMYIHFFKSIAFCSIK